MYAVKAQKQNYGQWIKKKRERKYTMIAIVAPHAIERTYNNTSHRNLLDDNDKKTTTAAAQAKESSRVKRTPTYDDVPDKSTKNEIKTKQNKK